MPQSAAAKAKPAKLNNFPVKLATIEIHDQRPIPDDLAVVETRVGKVQFKNYCVLDKSGEAESGGRGGGPIRFVTSENLIGHGAGRSNRKRPHLT
jgi:hypothetical protein